MVHFSIFDEEEVEEVGQEIEAYCIKCVADTPHMVITRYEDEIKRVRCNACDDTHPFRQPKGEEDEAVAGSKKKALKAKPTWEQMMSKNKKEAKVYNINDIYEEMDFVSHPTFGFGFVTELIDHQKIEISFQHNKRILIHNRQGKPLVLPNIAVAQPAAKANKRFSREAQAEGHLDPLLDIPDDLEGEDDLLIGTSTRLSPQARAAWNKDDEEDLISVDEEDAEEDLDEPSSKKSASKSTKGKTEKKASSRSSSRKSKK